MTDVLDGSRDDDPQDDLILDDDILDDGAVAVAEDGSAPGDDSAPADDTTDADSVESDGTAVEVDLAPGVPVASWSARAGAFAVDVILGAGLFLVFMIIAWSSPLYGWLWWVALLIAALVFLAVAANRVVLPVTIGWSLGRWMFGIEVVRRDGRPLDPWLLLLRDLAHIVDTLPVFAGWFWPLWDSRGRTFADILVGTEVHPVPRERRVAHSVEYRLFAKRVLAGTAALALAGAALGYFGVFRADKAEDRARAEIAEQGPKIVPDVLSYSAGSLDDDFKAAQALVTDSYRPQLVAQQDAVRAATPVVDNTYWVTNSAVLSATDDQAQMLLFMQGQRGAATKQRFITATVRASFAKSSGGQWQLADLNVLTKPVAPQLSPPQPGPAKPTESAQPSPSQAAKPSEGKPSEGKPSASKPPESKAAESTPSQSVPNPPKQGR